MVAAAGVLECGNYCRRFVLSVGRVVFGEEWGVLLVVVSGEVGVVTGSLLMSPDSLVAGRDSVAVTQFLRVAAGKCRAAPRPGT